MNFYLYCLSAIGLPLNHTSRHEVEHQSKRQTSGYLVHALFLYYTDNTMNEPTFASHPLCLKINGESVQDLVEPHLLLVDYLRDRRQLNGTHIGCDTSQCGACTIELDGRAAKSCSVLALQAQGKSVTTVEGLSTQGELDDLQQAFSRHHALQCGYCTPGMLMAAREILRNHATPTEEQVRHSLHGNICRCTGYQGIVDAILETADNRRMAQETSQQTDTEQGAGS